MADKVVITKSKLDNLARAVSNKSGATLDLTIDQMVAAVNSIVVDGSSGIVPTGTIQITSNGTVDVTNYANAEVNVPTGSTINNQNKSVTPTESQQSITADSGYTGLGTVTVGAISSTYVGSGITRRTSSDLTASGATVSVPAGYYSAAASKSVASGSATAPASISGTSATISTGTNTLTLTKTVSVTPTVSAGYVSSGTAGNASVSLTASVTTKGATTYHPSTTAQSISSGTYLTGTQTINAVTTSNLTADNIKSGVTVKIGDSSDDDCVASILGTYTGGSGASNIVQGSFTATSTSGGTTTVTVPYTGSGYPIAFIISLDGGSTYDTTTKRYAITAGYGVKKLTANAMTYDKTASNDGFSVQCMYKGTSGTTFSTGGNVSATIGNQDAPSASTSLWVSIHSKTDFRFFTMVGSYGLYPGKKYNYTIIYSS